MPLKAYAALVIQNPKRPDWVAFIPTFYLQTLSRTQIAHPRLSSSILYWDKWATEPVPPSWVPCTVPLRELPEGLELFRRFCLHPQQPWYEMLRLRQPLTDRVQDPSLQRCRFYRSV